jgi:Winged helix DNA-binding domain
MSGASPAEITRAIAGAQSQDKPPGRQQLRVRSRGLTAADVEAARIEERSVIRHWVMRMTVHLFPTEDFGWLAPLFSERIVSWSMRRLEALGLTPSERDRALAAIRKAVRDQGAVTRNEAMAIAERTGIEVDVQRRTHLSVVTVVGGAACIGPDHGRGNTFVDTREWIGEVTTPGREESLAELGRRYFSAFAPATLRDFAKWAGLPLGECRIGMELIAGELEPVGGSGQALFAPRGFDMRVPRGPAVRLLPAFDTYLMGYASRSHAVGEAGEKVILPGGGVLRPTICVDGRFAGTWSQKKSAKRLDVTLEPFGELDEAWMPAIESEAAAMARFEGLAESKVSGSA